MYLMVHGQEQKAIPQKKMKLKGKTLVMWRYDAGLVY
jgi:hypothetical protein